MYDDLHKEYLRKKASPKSEVISKDGEFTVYDTTHGHCGFCGSISCTGTCFK